MPALHKASPSMPASSGPLWRSQGGQTEHAKETESPGPVGPTSQTELPAHMPSPVTHLQENFKVCRLQGFTKKLQAQGLTSGSKHLSFFIYCGFF